MWRHEDIFYAAMGGGDLMQTGTPISCPEEIAERVPDFALVALATPPLMHVSAQWVTFVHLFGGGKVVFAPPGPFDPDVIWRLVAEENVNTLTIVGDAMGRPLAEAFAAAAAAGQPYDASSLFVIGSGGALLSPASKARITELLPNVMLMDGFGSSETGIVGTKAATAGGPAEGPRFTVNDQTAVLDARGRPVVPGDADRGRLPTTPRRWELRVGRSLIIQVYSHLRWRSWQAAGPTFT